MTGLHRTPLTASQKVKCAAMALAGQEVRGTISALSDEFDISRPTVRPCAEGAVRGSTVGSVERRRQGEPQRSRSCI